MNPKYLLYFNLLGSYNETEFATIKKIITNLIAYRYYNLDITIQFNEEIMNYQTIKKELSNDIMLIMGQIDDDLVDDLVYEVTSILGIDKVLRRRSIHDFNSTGYSDEELNMMYQEYLEEVQKLETSKVQSLNLTKLKGDFKYYQLPFLSQDDYLDFCNLFLENYHNPEAFLMLQELNVLEALFSNFPYFLKYLQLINLPEIIKLYSKDTIKIIRNIRTYADQSDEYNDNIKELFAYKLILDVHFKITEFHYDPEEGFNEIKNQIEIIISKYEQEIIASFNQKIKLFKNDYPIISIADPRQKTFQEYMKIAKTINKHFDKLKPLLKSFRSLDKSFVKFNSKMKYPERIKTTLELFKQSGIVKEYHEKYGVYSIDLATTEHVPFLQGQWFECYTATLCQEIIESFQNQGYNIDYQIYQNVICEIDGNRRELDLIVYLNGTIFYIENKIESKNAFRTDIEKYRQNIEQMNIEPYNCYLVYLEGEERQSDYIKFCNLQTFKNKFKKEVLKILEAVLQKEKMAKALEEKAKREEEQAQKAISKERTSLYLRYRIDYEAEEKKIRRAIERYQDEILKISLPSKDHFFQETRKQIEELNDEVLLNMFIQFQEHYEAYYYSKLAFKMYDKNFFKKMAVDLHSIDENNKLRIAYDKLLCLSGDIEEFLSDSSQLENKLLILCGYGDLLDNYIDVIKVIFEGDNILSQDRSCYLLNYYIEHLTDYIIRDQIIVNEFLELVLKYAFSLEHILNNRMTKASSVQALKKEKEFIAVFICTFMKKHFKDFSYYGLVFNNLETFIYRIATNEIVYAKNLQQLSIGKYLTSLHPHKIAYYEEHYQDLSTFICENYQELKNDLDVIIDCDEHLTFKVTKSANVEKLMKLLKDSGIIADYKEIKSLNLYLGIYTNLDRLNWLKNKAYFGAYLCLHYQSEKLLNNVNIEVGKKKYRIVFIHELKSKILMVLARNQDLSSFAIEYIDKVEFNNVIRSLNDRDFHYQYADVLKVCDSKVLKKSLQFST